MHVYWLVQLTDEPINQTSSLKEDLREAVGHAGPPEGQDGQQGADQLHYVVAQDLGLEEN